VLQDLRTAGLLMRSSFPEDRGQLLPRIIIDVEVRPPIAGMWWRDHGRTGGLKIVTPSIASFGILFADFIQPFLQLLPEVHASRAIWYHIR
jgi:hypothetical protein